VRCSSVVAQVFSTGLEDEMEVGSVGGGVTVRGRAEQGMLDDDGEAVYTCRASFNADKVLESGGRRFKGIRCIQH